MSDVQSIHLPWTQSFSTKQIQFSVPEVVRIDIGEVTHEHITSSFDRMTDLGSEVVRQPEEEVAQQSKSSQANQIQTQIMTELGEHMLSLK